MAALQHRRVAPEGRWGPVLPLLIVQLLIGIALTANRSFFPVFVSERLGYAAVFVSSLVATQQVAGMISALIGGSLCDVLGPKRTLLVGLLGYGLGSLTFLIGEPWLVAVLWACSGLAMGMHTLGGMAYLMEAASPRRLGTFSALYNWGITIGGALASPMLGVVLDRRGFGTLGAVLVTLAVATTCGAAVALSSVRSGRSNQTRHLGQTLLSYRTIIRRPPIALLGLLRFLPTCYWGMAGVLIPLLINRLASSKTTIAWFAATSQVLAALSQFAVGRAADRWGRKAPTIVALGVLVGSCLGMAVFADRLWSFFTFGVTATMAAWSLSTLMICLVADTSSSEERGRVLGMLHVLWNLAMITGSLLGGILVEVAAGLPFLAAAALNVAAIGAVLALFRMPRVSETGMIGPVSASAAESDAR